MVRPMATKSRARGEIETLPSGSLRVRVYAGVDPVSKKKHYLTETVPAGPKADKLAEKARTRLLAQVDERRNPRTNATVSQLINSHLDLLDASPSWISTCRGYHRLHIGPLIGLVKAGALGADVLDSFYAELRRCRVHCNRRPYVEHRTARRRPGRRRRGLCMRVSPRRRAWAGARRQWSSRRVAISARRNRH
jgi:integrase